MATLGFRKDLVGPILAGAKQQTYRRTKPRGLFVHDVVIATFKREPFARLRITSVREVKLSEMGDYDARWDGYEGVEHFRKAMDHLYPEAERLWRIGFTLIDAYTGLENAVSLSGR